jgi:SAM-dependent methyltransferase
MTVVPRELYTGDWSAFKTQEEAYNKAFDQLSSIEHIKSCNKILDIGCGPGRLALGLINNNASIEKYVGVDVNKTAVDWCSSNLTTLNGNYEFFYLNKYNARYASSNSTENSSYFDIDAFKNKYDLVYLYSVFSHLVPDDLIEYLNVFKNLLEPNGVVYTTIFVGNAVDTYEENPTHLDFLNFKPSGRLHVCYYNKNYFEGLVKNAGLKILECSYRFQEENDGQMLYILSA